MPFCAGENKIMALYVRDIQAKTEEFTERILAVFTAATSAEISAGRQWYDRAKRSCRILADDHDLPLDVAIAVTSAVSPGLRWEKNLHVADVLIRQRDGAVVQVYPNNKSKALRILADHGAGAEFDPAILGNAKTRAFYHNIMDPAGSERVTIDRHAVRVVLIGAGADVADVGNDKAIAPYISTDGKYSAMEHIYTIAAGIVGMLPLRLQAITWTTFRTRHAAWSKVRPDLNGFID
jgi:hypothetical protein